MWHDEEHDFDDHAEEFIPKQKQGPSLTEEEKKKKVEELKALMEEKRRIREEEAARQKRSDELKRRLESKTTAQAKREWEEQKVRMEAEKIRKQKEKDEAYKRKVLERIRKEKGVRSDKIQPKVIPVTKKDYTECQLQIRMKHNNAVVKWSGDPQSNLYIVAEYVAKQTGVAVSRIAFSTTFPRKVYSSSQLKTTTLKQADLVPRGVLICTI